MQTEHLDSGVNILLYSHSFDCEDFLSQKKLLREKSGKSGFLCGHNYYYIQNAAYNGTTFLLSSKAKFFADSFIAYSGL